MSGSDCKSSDSVPAVLWYSEWLLMQYLKRLVLILCHLIYCLLPSSWYHAVHWFGYLGDWYASRYREKFAAIRRFQSPAPAGIALEAKIDF